MPFTTFSSFAPFTAASAMRAEVLRISIFDSTLQNAAWQVAMRLGVAGFFLTAQRLVFDHIESCACKSSFVERGENGGLFDDGSTSGVHDEGTRFEQRKLALGDEMARFIIQRAMEREDIGLSEKFIECAHSRDADGLVRAVGQIRIVEDDAEAERLGPQRCRGADATEADDAKGERAEAAELGADFDVPAELLGLLIEWQDLAAQGHGEGDGMIRDLLGAVVGHVAHSDAALASGGDVHAVKADAVADDGAAVFELGDALRRERHVVPDDDGVGAGDLVIEISIGVAEMSRDLSGAADDGFFDGGLRIALWGGAPVNDGDVRNKHDLTDVERERMRSFQIVRLHFEKSPLHREEDNSVVGHSVGEWTIMKDRVQRDMFLFRHAQFFGPVVPMG
jgi:hypothetical protein